MLNIDVFRFFAFLSHEKLRKEEFVTFKVESFVADVRVQDFGRNFILFFVLKGEIGGFSVYFLPEKQWELSERPVSIHIVYLPITDK